MNPSCSGPRCTTKARVCIKSLRNLRDLLLLAFSQISISNKSSHTFLSLERDSNTALFCALLYPLRFPLQYCFLARPRIARILSMPTDTKPKDGFTLVMYSDMQH